MSDSRSSKRSTLNRSTTADRQNRTDQATDQDQVFVQRLECFLKTLPDVVSTSCRASDDGTILGTVVIMPRASAQQIDLQLFFESEAKP